MAKTPPANVTTDPNAATSSAKPGDAVSKATKPAKARSPNYPSINLETAVSKTNTLYQAFRRHKMPQTQVIQKMEYKSDSSVGQQVVAALKAFGLIEVEGTGPARLVAVTDSGEKIVRSHPDRSNLLRTAALAPKIHKELWDKFYAGAEPTPVDVVKQYLEWDRDAGTFTHQAMSVFLKQFGETAAFAQLTSSAKLSDEDVGEADADPESDQETPPMVPATLPSQKPRTPTTPPAGSFPLPVLMDDGQFALVHIPRMSQTAFDFLKSALDTYKPAIVNGPAL